MCVCVLAKVITKINNTFLWILKLQFKLLWTIVSEWRVILLLQNTLNLNKLEISRPASTFYEYFRAQARARSLSHAVSLTYLWYIYMDFGFVMCIFTCHICRPVVWLSYRGWEKRKTQFDNNMLKEEHRHNIAAIIKQINFVICNAVDVDWLRRINELTNKMLIKRNNSRCWEPRNI